MGKGRDWVEMKAHSSATTCKDWRIAYFINRCSNSSVEQSKRQCLKSNCRNRLSTIPRAAFLRISSFFKSNKLLHSMKELSHRNGVIWFHCCCTGHGFQIYEYFEISNTVMELWRLRIRGKRHTPKPQVTDILQLLFLFTFPLKSNTARKMSPVF